MLISCVTLPDLGIVGREQKSDFERAGRFRLMKVTFIVEERQDLFNGSFINLVGREAISVAPAALCVGLRGDESGFGFKKDTILSNAVCQNRVLFIDRGEC